ncbi:hypothetical protein SUGI_1182380 [Cryptomeria japonica]|nr:hypothetical protein SUGI_1182380 [Cryptomeria japonica]
MAWGHGERKAWHGGHFVPCVAIAVRSDYGPTVHRQAAPNRPDLQAEWLNPIPWLCQLNIPAPPTTSPPHPAVHGWEF